MNILLGGYQSVSNKDLIEQGHKPRLRYETVIKDGKMSEHLKCLFCGVNITYDFKERDKFVREGRWDFEKDRPLHCGGSTCRDWNEEYYKDKARKMEEMFFALNSKGLAS